ncbi:MAG: phospholipase [Acidobacteria bacterium]|nr:phospholipase [Acidobacteriota bacterium]
MSTDAGSVATEHWLPATVHGRYLLEVPEGDGPWPLLVGFHGYGESAETHLEELRRLPGATSWALCAIEGLHRFYNRRTGDVVASWMTKSGREQSVRDNLAYIGAVVARVRESTAIAGGPVYAGFSQGGAMACRAAALLGCACRGLMILGSDVPKELPGDGLRRAAPVLVGRGLDDPWYTEEKMRGDLALLDSLDVPVELSVSEGGHEWLDPFRAAAGCYLAARR